MRGRGNLLKDEKVAALEVAFTKGYSVSLAQRETGVCRVTVGRYFKRFAARGKPRPSITLRVGGPRKIYRGPRWIGKAIDG